MAKLSLKQKRERIIQYFQDQMPEPETELNYSNPFELLVAVVLSAQCTDKRVNLVTPELFKRYPDPEHLASSTPEEVLPFIKSISYPNNKAKHLVGLGKVLVEQFHSVVPADVDSLQKLPGVGRKTANVIASVVFQQATMAVDTHVFRVSKRLGIAKQTDSIPLAVEKSLYKFFPKEIIPRAHHWLILHGRYTCKARNPDCQSCGLREICNYNQNKVSQSW